MKNSSNIIKKAKDDKKQNKPLNTFVDHNKSKQEIFKKSEEEKARLKKLKKELNVPVLKLG